MGKAAKEIYPCFIHAIFHQQQAVLSTYFEPGVQVLEYTCSHGTFLLEERSTASIDLIFKKQTW